MCPGQKQGTLEDKHEEKLGRANAPAICKHPVSGSGCCTCHSSVANWKLMQLFLDLRSGDRSVSVRPNCKASSAYCQGAKVLLSLIHRVLCSGEILPFIFLGAGRPLSSGDGVVKQGTRAACLDTRSCNCWSPKSISLTSCKGTSLPTSRL